MFPAVSSDTDTGLFSVAPVAGAPSPVWLAVPSPAMVVMMPVAAVTLRMRLLPESTMYRLPAVSIATSDGPLNCAAVASPLSPLDPSTPVPATVLMMPVVAVTLRMTWPLNSAMYRLPTLSTAMPYGLLIWAALASPPSSAML